MTIDSYQMKTGGASTYCSFHSEKLYLLLQRINASKEWKHNLLEATPQILQNLQFLLKHC